MGNSKETEENLITHVVYHGGCYDGFGAAFAVWLTYGDGPKYIPAYHGMKVPKFKEDACVLVCDFSWPREEMIALNEQVSLLKVLDHHKTAEAELKGLDFAEFDMERSGAVMTYEYLNPTKMVPGFFLYLQDRDLWTFRLDMSKQVSMAMRSYPFDFEVWSGLENRVNQLKSEGAVCQRLTEQMVSKMCDHALMGEIAGHVVPIANASVFFSEVGHELCKRYPDCPFSAYYSDVKSGQRVWGLRAISDFDVGELAKKFGGGGHQAASGFKTDRTALPPLVPTGG